MKLLLDTPLLLWAAGQPERLPVGARIMTDDASQPADVQRGEPVGSSDQIRPRPRRFCADARLLRRGLLDNGYDELAIGSEHAVAIANLPPIHKDPFDRTLVAQSTVEGIVLLTADPTVAQYPGPVRKVCRAAAAAP